MTLVLPEDFVAQAQEELARRQSITTAGLTRVESLEAGLSPKGRAVVNTESPRTAVDGSRQSSKSYSVGVRLIKRAWREKCASMYIAPTSKAARNAMWSKFHDLNDSHRLGIDLKEAAFQAVFPNGSVVHFEGAHDRKRVERLRGATITGDLVVDEAAFFADSLLQHLLGSVASSMFMTSRQSMFVASSPGMQRRGRFFEMCYGKDTKWDHKHFNVYDNPLIKDPAQALADMREANAWTESTPAYMREALGLWVDDATYNVYELTELNLIDHFPDGPWTTIMLIDFGKHDQTAIAVVGWREFDPALYVLHCEGHSDLDIEDVCQLAIPLRKKWNPIGTYGDQGGGGAQHMDYMRKRHGIPMLPVSKKPNYKEPAIRELNGDARRGNLKVLRSSPLVEQAQALQWDPVARAKGLWVEHPSMPNDLCDVALVYGSVQSRAYRAEEKPPPAPEPNSADYWKQWSDAGLKAAIARAEKHHEMKAEEAADRAFLLGGDE